jgi:hypothetical protein
MVAKHVHATVITRLHQYVRDESRPKEERQAMDLILQNTLPLRVAHYLFEGGNLRAEALDLSEFRALIVTHLDDLTATVEEVFQQGWPVGDSDVTTPENLRNHVETMTDGLETVILRLRSRLRWAIDQMNRLDEVRRRLATLDQADQALYNRCNSLIQRLKGTAHRRRSQAEGHDDTNTFNVLAAEGFLPGYGLENGSVNASAEIPFWSMGAMAFNLPRPPSLALREYVPGNLIYANGNRFVARHFHRDIDEHKIEMPMFEVSREREAIKEIGHAQTGAGLGTEILRAISVCDVDLAHVSHISDEEELRFQLGVAVYGIEKGQHAGGRALRWGIQSVHLMRGLHLRLVNIGATTAIEKYSRLGYPLCTTCGHSVSPLSSARQHEHFTDAHLERCHEKISPVGFYADVVADALLLPDCYNSSAAYSILETMRIAMTSVLDMHMDDLQIQVIGYVDRDDVDGILWDPMPGGSGLLSQLINRFGDVVSRMREVAANCPSVCETSCIDCLQTFRNTFYHKHLNRKIVVEHLEGCGEQLVAEYDIPAKMPEKPQVGDGHPVNVAEQKLKHLLQAAGFSGAMYNQQIKMEPATWTTTPDVLFRAYFHDDDEGVCIYLDGLSAHLHGNPETAQQDLEIRDWLRNNGYDVISIAVNELEDVGAMTRYFRRLSTALREDEIKERIKDDTNWFSNQ